MCIFQRVHDLHVYMLMLEIEEDSKLELLSCHLYFKGEFVLCNFAKLVSQYFGDSRYDIVYTRFIHNKMHSPVLQHLKL